MKKIGIKKFLVYKSHVFPQVRKPLRSVSEFFMHAKQIDNMTAKKMVRMLDEQQMKKLKAQKDLANHHINIQLRKYYQTYILPFQSCPDYYGLLFEYAKVKWKYFRQHNTWNFCQQQPFFLKKKEANSLLRILQAQKNTDKVSENQNLRKKQYRKIGFDEHQETEHNLDHQHNYGDQEIQKIPIEEQKVLYKIQRTLYPSQKLMVLNKFNQLYRKFLLNSQSVRKFLLEQTITQIKPFIITSPLQLYQSKNHQKTIKQCETQLLRNVQQRDKINVQFIKLLEERKHEYDFFQQKYNVTTQYILDQYRKQYYDKKKTTSFYSLLKS